MTRLVACAIFSCLALSFTPASAQDQPPSLSVAPGIVAPAASDAAPRAIVQTGLSDAPAPAAVPDAAFDPEITDVPVPQKTDSDVTVMKDPYAETFVKGTPANLSKLYWRLHVFDLGDDTAVDNFMLINECDLYQRYINDDFEWTKLREAARGMLQKERDEFSDEFIFILPVKLGRYDTEKGGFHLVENTHFDNVRRMEITGNSLSRDICGKTGEIKDYPRNLMLILKGPFTYTFAKVDEHVAQAYIIRKQKEVLDLEYDIRQNRYSRVAYVRLRVKLGEYQGNVRGQDGSILSILAGELQGIDMFEDAYGKMLLSMGAAINEQQGAAAPASGLAEGVKDVAPAQVPATAAPTSAAPTPAAAVTAPADDRTGKPAQPTVTPGAPPPHAGEAPSLKETMEADPPTTGKVTIEERVPASDTPNGPIQDTDGIATRPGNY